MTLIGEWTIDGVAYAVGRFEKATPLSGGMVVANEGSYWLRFAPDAAGSPAASLVVLLTPEDWSGFQRKVAAVDLILPDGVEGANGAG